MKWVFRFQQWGRAIHILRREKRIDDAASALRDSASQIPEAVSSTERQYLAMHEKLLQLAPAARELVAHGARLVDLASGRDTAQANIERAVGLIDSVLTRLADSQRTLGTLVEELRQAACGIQSLLRIEMSLAEAIAPLDYVQVMLRIESAQLAPEQQQVFADLTSEISALCARAKDSSAGNLESIAHLESLLRSAIADVEKRDRDVQCARESRRMEIAGALLQLSENISRNAQQQPAITSATTGLETEVNHAVIALQTHDIIAQRLDHTRSGFLDAEVVAREFAQSRRPADALRAKALLRVEAEQIRGIGDDTLQAQRELNRAVRAIHSHLRTFDANRVSWRQFSEITASVNETVQLVLDSLTGTRELIREAAASSKDVEELIRPCESLAQNVTGAVQEISNTMRFIALNAQIHAIKIGSGTGLEVLAAHTSDISRLTTEIGAHTSEGVVNIAACLHSGMNCVSRLRSECQELQEGLDRDAAAEEKALHGFRNSALLEAEELGSALERARDASASLLASADCSAMVSLLQEVRARAVELDRITGTGIPVTAAALGSMASGLKGKYSMSRELAAHERAIGIEAPLSGGEEGQSGSGIQVAEGIELF